MNENPVGLAILIIGSAVLFRWWLADLLARRRGVADPRALPGAVPCGRTAVWVAVAGSLVLLGAETVGEYRLGVVGQQRPVTVWFGVYTLSAAFLEELVFRGYLVVGSKGRLALWVSVGFFSSLFALVHPLVWEWREGGIAFEFSRKAWFSTAMIFVGSLWFYAVRFLPSNPARSLLPCIAAHLIKNLGVFAIKGMQGFVVGWY